MDMKDTEGVSGRYGIHSIDLTFERIDQEYKWKGDNIAVMSLDGTASMKLNNIGNPAIDFTLLPMMTADIQKIYITNTAQAGKTLTFAVGGAVTFYVLLQKAKLLNSTGSEINPAKEDGNLADLVTALEIIDDWDETDRCKVNLPAATETKISNIVTALQIIDDWDETDSCKTLPQFGGAAYSKAQSSTDAMIALGAKKLRDVIIKNVHATHEVYIGESQANVATFRAQSLELASGVSAGFTQIDLATLFILSSTAGEHAEVRILGVEE